MTSHRPPYAAVVFRDEEPRSMIRGFIANRTRFEDITGTTQAKQEFAKLPEELLQWLRAEGFREIGTYRESLFGFPLPWLPGVSFVDPTGTTRVSVRYNESMAYSPRGVMFTFFTYFDEGSAVVTWCVDSPSTKSTGWLESLGTTGSIAEDYARHRRHVEGRAKRGPVPVHVESMADIEATYFHYFRGVLPDDKAMEVFQAWLTFRLVLPAIFIGGLIYIWQLVS